jgi:hypothetical protein
MSETQWQQVAAPRHGRPYYFRPLDAGKMLLVHEDAQHGAWYWEMTAGPLPKGAVYTSGPDYATPEVAQGAADYHAPELAARYDTRYATR